MHYLEDTDLIQTGGLSNFAELRLIVCLPTVDTDMLPLNLRWSAKTQKTYLYTAFPFHMKDKQTTESVQGGVYGGGRGVYNMSHRNTAHTLELRRRLRSVDGYRKGHCIHTLEVRRRQVHC